MVAPDETSRSLVRFFVMSGRLKAEKRRGWVKKLGITHPESVADHSYRLALMTMVFSDSRGLDTEKAMRLAILHDLPEALVGDAMPQERSGKRKTELETQALERISRELPKKTRALYRAVWREFVEGKSAESRLVRQLDKLEMAIQAWEYAEGLGDASLVREFWATAEENIDDPDILKVLSLVEPS